MFNYILEIYNIIYNYFDTNNLYFKDNYNYNYNYTCNNYYKYNKYTYEKNITSTLNNIPDLYNNINWNLEISKKNQEDQYNIDLINSYRFEYTQIKNNINVI